MPNTPKVRAPRPWRLEHAGCGTRAAPRTWSSHGQNSLPWSLPKIERWKLSPRTLKRLTIGARVILMTAGLAVGCARRLDLEPTLRLAAAAGALKVTRHGLGTGQSDGIEKIAERVEVRPSSN